AMPRQERFWPSWRRRWQTEERARTGRLLERFLTLAEVADCAAFVASVRPGDQHRVCRRRVRDFPAPFVVPRCVAKLTISGRFAPYATGRSTIRLDRRAAHRSPSVKPHDGRNRTPCPQRLFGTAAERGRRPRRCHCTGRPYACYPGSRWDWLVMH